MEDHPNNFVNQNNLKEQSNFGFTWRFINKDGLDKVKEFQKRNKMSMQYLLMDKEVKQFKRQAKNDDDFA